MVGEARRRVCEPAQGGQDRVARRIPLVRPGPERREAEHDPVRVRGEQRVAGRAVVGDDEIGAAQVGLGDHLLVQIEEACPRRVEPFARQMDDVGAGLGEELCAQRPRNTLAKLDNPHAAQWMHRAEVISTRGDLDPVAISTPNEGAREP